MADSRRLIERITGSAGWQTGRLLDVRPAAEFAAGHLRGAVSQPLATPANLAADLPSILLPPRERPLLVVAATADIARCVAAEVGRRGRDQVAWVALAADDLAALPPEMVRCGAAPGRLWEPPGWLRRHADLLPPPVLGPAVDLGCGSGRAAVWLAERGFRVTGFDHEPAALDLGRTLAAGVGCRCDFRRADLRRPDQWPDGTWALVVAVRFLQRDLLAAVAGRIRSGGVALVRTFRDTPGHDGPPRRRHRLDPGELLRFFPRNHFEILAHGEDFDPDGRPAAGIVARRR